ncbi:uncharacterized protein A4U43_C08F2530 [Asparagus officinalis]|nr:uncharacterized protein A4U43_C08F2530 [Asparagus officinalis]
MMPSTRLAYNNTITMRGTCNENEISINELISPISRSQRKTMKKFKGFTLREKENCVSTASRNRATKYTPLDSSLSLQPKSKLPCHKIVKVMGKLVEFVSFFARVIPMSYSFRVRDQPPKGYSAVYVDEREEDGEQSQLQRNAV